MYKKNPRTGVVYNDDDQEHRTMMALRSRIRREGAICREIDDIKDEIVGIKSMLEEILRGVNGHGQTGI